MTASRVSEFSSAIIRKDHASGTISVDAFHDKPSQSIISKTFARFLGIAKSRYSRLAPPADLTR
jgi:hypothetical protein